MTSNIKRNRFNKLFNLSHRLNTQSPIALQRVMYLYTKAFNTPFYTFNKYKDDYISMELNEDIKRLKELNSKFSTKTLLKKYPLTKKQNLELNYLINSCLQGSKRCLQATIPENNTQYTLDTKIFGFRSNQGQNQIYTVGYEGKSIDELISLLHFKGISTLVDIRFNPLSYKFGYSIDELKKILPKFEIQYIHLKDLGVESSIRNNEENSLNDIWKYYKTKLNSTNLHLKQLNTISNLTNICLMCFEKDYKQCHRHILANHLKTNNGKESEHL